MHPSDCGCGFPRSKGVPDWPELSVPDFRPVAAGEFDRLAHFGKLHSVFDSITESHPDRLAVVGSKPLTYRELQQCSLAAASALGSFGVKRGDLVCIAARNDWQNIAAMLGVLRLGAICNLANPSDPPSIARYDSHYHSKVFYVIGNQEAFWISQLPPNLDSSPNPKDTRICALESLFETPARDIPVPREEKESNPPAFVFFTSGSTGAPQAVVMSHSFVLLDIARQINDLAIHPNDRFDLLFSPNFSAFLAPTFGALLTGASLWIRALDQSLPTDLIHWLIESKITISTMSVAVMRALFQSLPTGNHWPDLRILSVGGEPLRASDVLLFQSKSYARAHLQNAMATTETRTYAQCFFDHRTVPSDPIPIGYPVLDRRVEIVDENQQQLPTGAVGQVLITARGLADGYWPEPPVELNPFKPIASLTQFSSSDLGYVDETGLLFFVGRKDSMIKIRGQKVFLNQIESEILALQGVSDAFVFCLEKDRHSPSIVACVESSLTHEKERILSELSERLPPVARPTFLEIHPQFPKTTTGKIDRQALIKGVSHQIEERSRLSANTDWEDPLIDLLSTFLKRRVTPDTRIESLGIDSIESLDLCIEISKRFSKRVSWNEIQSCRTCKDLYGLIQSAPRSGPIQGIYSVLEGNPKLLLFTSIVGHRSQFQPLLDHLQNTMHHKSPFGIAVVESAGLQLPSHSEFTIPKFVQPLIQPVLDFAKSSPLVLAGHSWGGLIAFELARQLQLLNKPAAHLCLIDTVLRHRIQSNKGVLWLNRLRNLPAWVWNEAAQMSIEDWRREANKKLRRLKHPEKNDNLAPENSIYDQQYRAASDFLPLPYYGNATVLRASTQSLTRPVFGALGWEPYIHPKPSIQIVPGNHLSILNSNNSKHIAKLLIELGCKLKVTADGH